MRKALLVFLMLIITLGTSTTATASQIEKEKYQESKRISKIQIKKEKKFREFLEKEDKKVFFEQSYGGAYFEGEDLIINVKNEFKDKYKSKYDFDSEITLKYVKYSINDLDKRADIIENEFDRLDITTLSINSKHNYVEIQTRLSYDEAEKKLHSLRVYDGVKITSTNKQINLTSAPVEIVTGHSFYYSDFPSPCSVGFPARTNSGKYGFVSAGHCADSGWGPHYIYYNNVKVGVQKQWVFEEDATADAMFVQLYKPLFKPYPATLTNKLYGSTDTINYVSIYRGYVMLGRVVWFYGTNSTTPRSGVITDDDMAGGRPGNHFYIKDIFATDILVESGDSGGALVTEYAAGYGTTGISVIGVLSGIGGDYNWSYYSRIDNIMSELDLQYLDMSSLPLP